MGRTAYWPVLKPPEADAETVAAMIDTSLLEHWQRERKARERARASLPASWRDDPRPRMRVACEIFIETMLEMNRASSRVAAIGDDDR